MSQRVAGTTQNEHRFEDTKLVDRTGRIPEPLAKLPARPTPQRLELNVSIDELTHWQAEEGEGAARPEVHAQQRRFLCRIDHEESVVRSGDDSPGEALADTGRARS